MLYILIICMVNRQMKIIQFFHMTSYKMPLYSNISFLKLCKCPTNFSYQVGKKACDTTYGNKNTSSSHIQNEDIREQSKLLLNQDFQRTSVFRVIILTQLIYLPFHFIMKVFSFFPDKSSIGSPISNHSHVIYITILKRLQKKCYSLARGI